MYMYIYVYSGCYRFRCELGNFGTTNAEHCIPFTYRIHFVTGAKLSFVAHSVSLPVYDRKSCAQIYGTSDIGKRICAGYLHNGKGICKASF